MTQASPRDRRRARRARLQLKPLGQQVIVISGASSGIGVATARLAAKRGARVVIGSRNGEALQKLAGEIERTGGQVAYATVDAGQREDMEHLAQIATNRFGGIDTWINNAGVSLYGRLQDTSLEDMRNAFDESFWAVVHGSLAAIARLKRSGGALINVGGLVSDRAMPLHGPHRASRHAVKGFTEALRMELARDGAPVSVTLVRPAAIDMLLTGRAKNLVSREPGLSAPLYAPEAVARAILRAAERPQPNVYGGGAAPLMSAIARLAQGATTRHNAVIAAVGVMALTALMWRRRAPLRRVRRTVT